MYHRMEANHPSPKMRRQAEHLRFILEAPKLQRSPDEKVKIPILKDVERKCAHRTALFRRVYLGFISGLSQPCRYVHH